MSYAHVIMIIDETDHNRYTIRTLHEKLLWCKQGISLKLKDKKSSQVKIFTIGSKYFWKIGKFLAIVNQWSCPSGQNIQRVSG